MQLLSLGLGEDEFHIINIRTSRIVFEDLF